MIHERAKSRGNDNYLPTAWMARANPLIIADLGNYYQIIHFYSAGVKKKWAKRQASSGIPSYPYLRRWL
jgi:hypothetical protein